MRRSVLIIAAFCGIALLVGCTGPADTPADASPSSARSTTEVPSTTGQSPTSPSTPAPAVNADEDAPSTPINGDAWAAFAAPVEPRTTDKPMYFHDMRIGDHEGFTRVVIEFTGEGRPGLFQEWAEGPVEQGRGEPLPVIGNAHLDLILTGTAMPVDAAANAVYYSGPRSIELGGISVREDGTFEDTTHIVISMDTQRDIQIGFLEAPVRAVIDVKK